MSNDRLKPLPPDHLLSCAKAMEPYTSYFIPSPSLSPDSGGEDKGEGDNVAPIFVPLFMRKSIISGLLCGLFVSVVKIFSREV